MDEFKEILKKELNDTKFNIEKEMRKLDIFVSTQNAKIELLKNKLDTFYFLLDNYESKKRGD